MHLALTLASKLLATPIPDAVLQQRQPPYFNQEIVNTAINQIFADNRADTIVSNNFAQLWNIKAFPKKAKILWRGIFLPRELMMLIYPIQLDSRRLYFYYLVRCKDLLVRYSGKTWQLWHSEPQLAESTRDRNALLQWFEQTE